MKFSDFKKYLDLRKYVSLNVSAILGYYTYILTYRISIAKPLPPVDYGEGLVYPQPYAEEKFITTYALLLLFFLFLIEFLLRILITFICNKYFNKQPKEEVKKKKSKLFLFFEIIYSILFIIGNIPLFCMAMVFILLCFGIDI